MLKRRHFTRWKAFFVNSTLWNSSSGDWLRVQFRRYPFVFALSRFNGIPAFNERGESLNLKWKFRAQYYWPFIKFTTKDVSSK